MKTDLSTYDQHPLDREYGPTVLIVDDEDLARSTLDLICKDIAPRGSFRTIKCASVAEALNVLSETYVDVVLLDKNIPALAAEHQDGIEVIPEFLRIQPHLQILMVTGSSDIADVVKAMRYGALNYIVKGNGKDDARVHDLLCAQIKQAANIAKLTLEKIRNDRLPKKPSFNVLAGSSRAMVMLKSQLEMVAESNRPVLLLGESGTGKTTAAKYIHNLRQKYLKQTDRPFISINMASIAPSIAEGELFGNEAGAFTDAKQQRLGYVELANHGTLFLDEIGEASLDIQAKLLKVLEEGHFYRMGGKKELQSRFKLICATNRNLEQLCAEGKFRHDLLMRISTFPIVVPTIDERREDIPEIIASLLPKCCEENQVFINFEDLPKEFVQFVQDNKFDGNIRGIDHCLARLLVYSPRDKNSRPIFTNWKSTVMPFVKKTNGTAASDEITLKTLTSGKYNVISKGFSNLEATLESVEKNILSEALGKFDLQKDAAAALGISKGGLSLKLKRLGVDARALQ
jgi:DNA-binding NtrC family response regulator